MCILQLSQFLQPLQLFFTTSIFYIFITFSIRKVNKRNKIKYRSCKVVKLLVKHKKGRGILKIEL